MINIRSCVVAKKRCRKDQNSALIKQHPLKQIYSFKVTLHSVLLSPQQGCLPKLRGEQLEDRDLLRA